MSESRTGAFLRRLAPSLPPEDAALALHLAGAVDSLRTSHVYLAERLGEIEVRGRLYATDDDAIYETVEDVAADQSAIVGATRIRPLIPEEPRWLAYDSGDETHFVVCASEDDARKLVVLWTNELEALEDDDA